MQICITGYAGSSGKRRTDSSSPTVQSGYSIESPSMLMAASAGKDSSLRKRNSLRYWLWRIRFGRKPFGSSCRICTPGLNWISFMLMLPITSSNRHHRAYLAGSARATAASCAEDRCKNAPRKCKGTRIRRETGSSSCPRQISDFLAVSRRPRRISGMCIRWFRGLPFFRS